MYRVAKLIGIMQCDIVKRMWQQVWNMLHIE